MFVSDNGYGPRPHSGDALRVATSARVTGKVDARTPQFTSVFLGGAGGSGATFTPSSIRALTSVGVASP